MLRSKLIAMYFPQLHSIPENDKWWGKGFTDWNNVKRAAPLFPDHNQPRVPIDENYYNQSDVDTIRYQIYLAKKHGLYGFCHYHYWFDGKQLLETPTNLMLDNKDLDFPFCLSWANETWSRRWDGNDHDILIKQTHPPTIESWSKHFEYLIKAWTDKRAIKIDGKPVFVIYRPQKIEKLDEMLTYWKEKAEKRGLKGLYFIFQKQYEPSNTDCLKFFNGEFQFQPFEAIHSASYSQSAIYKKKLRHTIDRLPDIIQSAIWSVWASCKTSYTVHQYDAVWEQILYNSRISSKNSFSGAFVDWDNTARYGCRATIIQGASPERFKYWLAELVKIVSERPEDENYIFLNAWNEWAECAYLEPDSQHGYEYLEAVKEVVVGDFVAD